MTDVTLSPPPKVRPFASTRNACKLCAPLGACIAFRGVEGCIPLIHGSQGCSTYIRRYGISHFREPIDIASSNFTESSAIFGGKANLETALENVTRQYRPKAIGVTSTCLSETIGENVPMYLAEYARTHGGDDLPAVVYASTPSYKGTHMDGFHEAVRAIVSALVPPRSGDAARSRVNVIPGFVSTEDLRELHEILASFGSPYTLLPDYSESLDGGSWEEYQKLPEGGTPIDDIRKMGEAVATLYLGTAIADGANAGAWLEAERGVEYVPLDMPIGIEETDRLFAALERVTGSETPAKWKKARGRLVDAYIDGHKYCSGKRAIVYGDEDFVCSMVSFLDETGIKPVIVATGAPSERFADRVRSKLRNSRAESAVAAPACLVMDDADFATMLEKAKDIGIDLVVGNSKGYYLARNLGVPMVRCGFPVHDRMGGQRILHLGYRGAISLFDDICNALMRDRQEAAASGYTYI